jgi:hypothetical protein
VGAIQVIGKSLVGGLACVLGFALIGFKFVTGGPFC